jgi:glycerol kinase
MLQADGAIQQSKQVSKLQSDADKARIDAAESSNTTRKVILGIAAVAVVATGVAVYMKKRKR